MTALQDNIGKLDADIQATAIKVQHLDELVAANKELEKELEKKKERLPPEEEAVTLLKQLSDLGVRLGLDIKLWKPGTHAEDPSKLFVRMPVSVEVSGGYHRQPYFSIGSTNCLESSTCRICAWDPRKWSTTMS